MSIATRWNKIGLRVCANGSGLMSSHAMLPTPVLLEDRIRVFFSSCDRDLRGRIFYADLSREFPFALIRVEPHPVLEVGEAGEFDCDGVNPSCIVRLADGTLRLYYIGWRRVSEEIPYTLIGGLACSTDAGRSFTRSEAAILAPTDTEPFFRTAPYVWREGEHWRMLYIGGGRFFNSASGKRLPLYSLRQAISEDGVCWTVSAGSLLDPDERRGEIGYGRPIITLEPDGRQTLLISRRTIDGYKQMQAPWPLAAPNPELTPLLEPGPEEWDREMTCFAAHLKVDGRDVLFYNGNGFGRSGFGVAFRQAL